MKVVRDNDGVTIYTHNSVTEELVQEVIKQCDLTNDWISVSFDVIGRTRHVGLACELVEKLSGNYEANIDYDMYWCKIKRKDV